MFNKVLEDYFGNGFNNYIFKEKKRETKLGVSIDPEKYEIKQVNILVSLNKDTKSVFCIGKATHENSSPLELEILLDIVLKRGELFKITYEFATGLPSYAEKIFLINLESKKEADVDKISDIVKTVLYSLNKYRKSLERTMYGKEK